MRSARADRIRLWTIGSLATAAIVILAALSIALAFHGLSGIAESHEWVTHTSNVIRAAQETEIAVQDAERGQRGYLLTSDESYLSAFEDGIEHAPAALAQIRILTADNPTQQSTIDQLEQLISAKLALLKRTVELRRAGRGDEALVIVRQGAGLRLMRQIAQTIDRITSAEDALLVRRDRNLLDAERAVRRDAILATVVAVLGLVLSAAGGIFALRRAQSSERILQATLDGLPQGVLAAGADGRPVAWNAKFADLLRAPPLDPVRATVPARGVVQPLAERAETTGRVATAITPLPENRSAELIIAPVIDGGFVASVSDVTDRLQTEAINRHAQKMDAIGQMTGGLAHDFNNLLTVVMGSLERLNKLLAEQPAARRQVDLAMMGAERGAQLNRQLLAFARRQPLAPRVLDAGEVVTQIDALLRRTLGERIALRVIVAADLWPALADRAQLESALLNLSLNARDAIEAKHGDTGGTLLIELANAQLSDAYAARELELEPGAYVMLAVTDDGSGMPAEVRARAFDPFFTTKGPGRGTGLGLSQIYGFAKQSGGHAKIYSEPGQGTTIKLYLPRATEAATDVAAQASDNPTWSGERVLVVEDDPNVRQAVVGMLHDLGFTTIEAEDGAAALAELDAVGGEVSLIFTDVVMPGPITSRAMAKAAVDKYPHLRVLYTSGYTENAVIHHGRLDPDVQLLSKPYRRDELAARLRDVLA